MRMDFATFKEKLLNPLPDMTDASFFGQADDIDGESALGLKNLFFFLALIFRYPREEVYTEISRHMEAFGGFFREYADAIPEIPKIEDLQAEYVSLFVNNRGFVPAIPYASCHIDEGLLMGKSLIALRRTMHKAGFMLDGSVRELEDHLSVLLEFCACVVDILIEEKKAGDCIQSENISVLLEITYRYIDPILDDFIKGIDAYASFTFYKTAGQALKRFIQDSDTIYAQMLGFGNCNE